MDVEKLLQMRKDALEYKHKIELGKILKQLWKYKSDDKFIIVTKNITTRFIKYHHDILTTAD